MATKRLTFFALPSEVLPLLGGAIEVGSLAASFDQGDDIVTEGLLQSSVSSEMALRLNVFRPEDAVHGADFIRNNRRSLGVVRVELGGVSENVLFISEMSCSDEYSDPGTGKLVKSEHRFTTFNICVRLLRHLWVTADVFAESLQTGNTKGPYTDIRVSRGAADCYEAGGILKQSGVANVKFGLIRRQI